MLPTTAVSNKQNLLLILIFTAILSLSVINIFIYQEFKISQKNESLPTNPSNAMKKVMGVSSDLDKERVYWKNLLNLHPNYLPGWIELSKIEYKLGNLISARKAIQSARSINPNSLEIKHLKLY